MPRELVVVGLGPGDPKHLTAEAVQLLKNAKEIYVRTTKHPTVQALPTRAQIRSFDHLYEELDSFEQVYDAIAHRLVDATGDRTSRRPVIYAVPGSPSVGEESVLLTARLAEQQSIPLRIIQGLSFVEPVLQLVGADPLIHGLQVLDATRLAAATEKRLWDVRNLVNTTQACLIGQIHNRRVASHVKIALLEIYPASHEIVLVSSAGVSGAEQVKRVPLHLADHEQMGVEHLASLFVPSLPPEDDVTTCRGLEWVVARLRGPAGCPWDQEQTHDSLKPFLIEEAYEVLDALDSGKPEKLSEELGDLLLQVVLHAELAAERDDFNMGTVLAGINTKLIRRHPHVFGSVSVRNADDVVRNWEQIKKGERAAARDAGAEQLPESVLSGVPAAMPALSLAQELQRRAARIGFDWPDTGGILEKVVEEARELQQTAEPSEQVDELGDLLFTIVNLARRMGIDAEGALRMSGRKFRERLGKVERMAFQRGLHLPKLTLEQLDELWEEAKASEGSEPSSA